MAIFISLLVAPLVLWAQRVEKIIETDGEPEVQITNPRGQVTVQGWDKTHVHAICNFSSPQVELDAETLPRTGKASRVELTTHGVAPAAVGASESADCTIQVPAASSIDIRNRQGSVTVNRIEGQHARLETTDGKITASGVTSHLVARSLAGDIEIIRPTGRVEAFSITGNLTFVDPAARSLRGNTNSGRILYRGDFMATGEYILSTYSGQIEVLAPREASFDLMAKSVKGKVENTFSLTPRRHATAPFPSTNSLFGSHSTGNARVELTSFSGPISVREQR
jgi:DUF4097 and DUF4098 domain-containing protein YvlB